MRRFKELFGISPKVVNHVWRLLAENEALGRLYPVHLLWACYYMKSYGRDAQNASFANVSEKTFRRWVKLALMAIESLEDNVV
jgi:AraC-like DNA-binding protein